MITDTHKAKRLIYLANGVAVWHAHLLDIEKFLFCTTPFLLIDGIKAHGDGVAGGSWALAQNTFLYAGTFNQLVGGPGVAPPE